MSITQAERQIQLFTPLGDDVLYLDRFTGREEISRLFRFEMGLYSEDREIAFDDIVGQGITVSVDRVGAGPRFFHGFVSSFEHVMDLEEFAYYRAVAVPWLWFLTRSANCRIFQGQSAPDIVHDVIREHGFSDVEVHLTDDYEPLEYCTQYRESDFNFLSRLMEEFGIHYSFRHESDRHVLRIADSISAHDRVDGLEELPFQPATEDNRRSNAIWSWTVGREVQPHRYEVRDFDYHSPGAPVVSNDIGEPKQHDHSEHEVYDYAGLRMTPDPGSLVAAKRVDEFQARFERAHGEMGTPGLGTGDLFRMTDAPRPDQDREYLITGAEHRIRTNRFRSGGVTVEGEDTYLNRFSCVAADSPFRPPRVTPRPLVYGPQTAIVTGPEGEEIYTDNRARIKVRFHWDRAETPNEDSSIWLRVAQTWAGNAWGSVFVPRVGHEVVVEFLEGDPDRPIVTGSVYNEANEPPFLRNLEEDAAIKTYSAIASSSSKGGEGSNIILFRDETDNEVLGLKAQRDLNIQALHDRLERIDGERHLVVGGNQRDRVEKNRHEVVKKSHSESIGGDRNLSVGGKEAKKVTETQSLTVDADRLVSISGSHTEDCASYSLSAGEVSIEASSKITLTCGGSSVEIGPGAVKVTSPKIEFSGGEFKSTTGTVTLTAGAIDLTAPMVKTPAILQTTTVIATAVVSTSYTPGAGNIW